MNGTDGDNHPPPRPPPPPGARLRAWGELLRAPNLLTVPGDPVAGFFLAATVVGWPGNALSRLLPAAGMSLLLYGVGLIQNDLADQREDAIRRPERPLPRGRVTPAAAMLAVFILLAGVVVLALRSPPAARLAAGGLCVAIALYNGLTKRLPFLGPLNMGACRGLSLLVGAASAGTGGAVAAPALLSACGVTLYVAAVTAIAARETQTVRVGARALLPMLVIAGWFAALHGLLRPAGQAGTLASLALGGAAALWAGAGAAALRKIPAPSTVQQTVGSLLRGLLLLQGALALVIPLPGVYVAAGLVAALPVAGLLGRRFRGS